MTNSTSRVLFLGAAFGAAMTLCGCGGGSAASNFAANPGVTTSALNVTPAAQPTTGSSSATSTGTGSTSTSATSTGDTSTSAATTTTTTSTPTATPATPSTPTQPAPVPTPSGPPQLSAYGQVMSMPFQAGITHVDGRYSFTTDNFLIEGAQKILDVGSPAIFVYMTANFRQSYPDRGTTMWPTNDPASLTELAQTAPFQKLFSMPFQTIVITAYGMANGDNYQQIATDPNAAAAEEKEFYDFARYLLSTYAGTGKTFIIKHWEGDFIGLGGFDSSQDIPQQNADAMVTWLKTRQRAITRARQDAGNPPGVGVFNAVECSLVLDLALGQSKVRVINAVVPQVAPDMVTYSSWDSTMQGSDPSTAAAAINLALDTIKKYAPDPLGLGNRRILISEYGVYETSLPAQTVWRTQTILDTAKSAGLLGAFFWEVFDNECKNSSGTYFPVATLPNDPNRPQNSNCDGLSIVRPDGSTSPTVSVLSNYWK